MSDLKAVGHRFISDVDVDDRMSRYLYNIPPACTLRILCTADECENFSCLPPFTGTTVAQGPSHLVGLNSTFRCCTAMPVRGSYYLRLC